MKKSIAVILLGSALLLPNNNSVEASHLDRQTQVKKVQYIDCVGWEDNHSNFKNGFYKMQFNWKDFLNKFSGGAQPDKKPAPEVGGTPDAKPVPKPEGGGQAPDKAPVTPAPKPVEPTPETPSKPNEEAPGASVSAMEQAVLKLTNAERQKVGLAPLQIDNKLMSSAQAKSKDMSSNKYFSHTSPTYGSPFDQMKKFGVSYRSAAENIAQGQRSAEEVVKAWMASPGHRQNILGANFTHIGIGYDANGHYWTQQFIQK